MNSQRARPVPTIYAPATAPGRGALSIIRISGPQSGAALARLAGARPPPRQARLAALRHPETGILLDRALILWFERPASSTGEDTAELYLHGGRAVLTSVLDALQRLPGLRLAEPGEFARQAFANGKLDLTQAEAIADLVAAETAAQQRQALRQLDGALGQLYGAWRGELVAILARLEAELDFPDEDLPEELDQEARAGLEALLDAVTDHLADGGRGEKLRDGLSVVILGPPNVGKSSLLNRLAARDAAIVSERAGTTRDVIEVAMDLAGFPVTLADTAGLRDSGDEIEQEGVRRARRRAETADLRLLVADARDCPALPASLAALQDPDAIVVYNKADLCRLDGQLPDGAIAVSAVTGAGLDLLQDRLARLAEDRLAGTAPALTRARHREALMQCRDSLARALCQNAAELRAEDVRLAARALGRVTGRVDVEEVLDAVFADFCIGK